MGYASSNRWVANLRVDHFLEAFLNSNPNTTVTGTVLMLPWHGFYDSVLVDEAIASIIRWNIYIITTAIEGAR